MCSIKQNPHLLEKSCKWCLKENACGPSPGPEEGIVLGLNNSEERKDLRTSQVPQRRVNCALGTPSTTVNIRTTTVARWHSPGGRCTKVELLKS
ncbi:hypothetical protein MPTK1_1g21840 [Marchantia polymorpha subsp. ruderalis]|uniref:Uncharacterized protein n=2 Tax=Marchantia polymorpha TaxID=3197 RepID=A0AAF6ASV2_MARPO|nr:hypothetical protein MARPO_0001s0520 [Marchantia polymorpha]BBM99522.1 hypothetical protein Mp_1g21840 [Marchantia polymorpha subsp. ruderalis]|eukprot:PTQ50605.1 hypothetical protein MARPO_0001s0520 [Marchantia polymorpha]